MAVLDDLNAAVQAGKKKDVATLTQQAIDEGVPAGQILDEGLIAAMTIVGDKFSRNEVFVPEMLVAARAMTAGTDVLKPYLVEGGGEPLGYAVIGTVKGDMHDIGKNLVRMMIEGKGVEIVDLGVDVEPDGFVNYLKEHPEVQLLCLSALLTTTLPMITESVEAIKAAGLRDQVKILIGGAPVTQAFADELGVDGYADDAGAAATAAAALLA